MIKRVYMLPFGAGRWRAWKVVEFAQRNFNARIYER